MNPTGHIPATFPFLHEREPGYYNSPVNWTNWIIASLGMLTAFAITIMAIH